MKKLLVILNTTLDLYEKNDLIFQKQKTIINKNTIIIL